MSTVSYQGSPIVYTATGSLNDASIDLKNYQLVRELGRGAFGVTWLAVDLQGNQYAVKVIDYQAAVNMGMSAEQILGEAASLQDLASGNCNRYVVCYYGSWDFTYLGNRYVAIISDYVDGMTLSDYLQQPQFQNARGTMPPQELWALITQLFLGLQWIHSQGYAHRDIKTQNIMITRDGQIKYIDFGLACTRKCNQNGCVDSCIGGAGTILYEAPEMFNGTYQQTLAGAMARDVWAVILVCYELAGGNYRLPFTVSDSLGQWLPTAQIVQNILTQPHLPAHYQMDDGRTAIVLQSMVVNDPTMRPNINQVINAWMVEVNARPYGVLNTGTLNTTVVTGNVGLRTTLQPVLWQ
jgi:serine/threonine protein kinase